VLPSIYVSEIAVAPRGAWPLALWDLYPDDEAALARYMALARTRDGLARFLSEWPDGQRAAA
jgi:glutaconate CoA-transferase subunit A